MMMLPHLGMVLQIGYGWLAKPWMLLLSPDSFGTRIDSGPTTTSTHAIHALSG